MQPPSTMKTAPIDWDALDEFIAIRSVQGLPDENVRAIEFVRARLHQAGF